jgi:hypothetical protein
MTQYDPRTSWGKIIRVNKYNPEEFETIGGLIQGQDAILEKLRELKENEPHRKKWGYMWKWVKRDAAGIEASKKSVKQSKREEADADW